MDTGCRMKAGGRNEPEGRPNEGVGGGGMRPRLFKRHLATSTGMGWAKQIREGWKGCWNVEQRWVGAIKERGRRTRQLGVEECARPLERRLATSNGVGETNQRGWKERRTNAGG